MRFIIARLLKGCRTEADAETTVADFLEAAPATWRTRFVSTLNLGNTACLLPLSSALVKLEELQDRPLWTKAWTKVCPRSDEKEKATPPRIAVQFFYERMFLSALGKLD